MRQTFVYKVMSLLFNMLSRFVIAFLPKEQASFNFMAAFTTSDFGAQENKVCHCFYLILLTYFLIVGLLLMTRVTIWPSLLKKVSDKAF